MTNQLDSMSVRINVILEGLENIVDPNRNDGAGLVEVRYWSLS